MPETAVQDATLTKSYGNFGLAGYQRRTARLRDLLEKVALALAGRAGCRLAAAAGTAVSRFTLIRLVRALPDPEAGPVTVLGVDDVAKRKGHSYATVLMDMDSHRLTGKRTAPSAPPPPSHARSPAGS